eukprot:6666-Heterococcus_DN1.PRE.2
MDSFLHKAEAMARAAASQTIDKAANEAGFAPWGNETAYGLKNTSTGMFLAAHKDGELVAEDDTTAHHDLVWRIFTRGGQVALQSCHGTWLSSSGGTPNSTATAINSETTWTMQGSGSVQLISADGNYLSAVPPVEGQPAVFLRPSLSGAAETWAVEPIAAATALLSRLEGAVF